MTAIPSPAFVAIHLGALLAGQTGPLTNSQKRALAYAVEVLTLEQMDGPAGVLAMSVVTGDIPFQAQLLQLAEALADRERLKDWLAEVSADLERAETQRLELVTSSNAVGTLDGPGAVGVSHPDTSRQAAESVAQSAKMERLRVLASVIEDGPASASVIAGRLRVQGLDGVPNQVAARAWELRKGKWLEWRAFDSDSARAWASDVYEADPDGFLVERTPSGRKGRVLFLTASAVAELIRQHGSLEVAAKLLREGRLS